MVTQLAVSYAAARDIHGTEVTKEPFSAQEAQLLREGTFVVLAGQLSKWVLDDLQDETSDVWG